MTVSEIEYREPIYWDDLRTLLENEDSCSIQNQSVHRFILDNLIQHESTVDQKKLALRKAIELLDKKIEAIEDEDLKDLKASLIASSNQLKEQQNKLVETRRLEQFGKWLGFNTRDCLFKDAMVLTHRLIFKAENPTHDNNLKYGFNTSEGRLSARRISRFRCARVLGNLCLAVFGLGLLCVAVASVATTGGLTLPLVAPAVVATLSKFGIEAAVLSGLYLIYELMNARRKSKLGVRSAAGIASAMGIAYTGAKVSTDIGFVSANITSATAGAIGGGSSTIATVSAASVMAGAAVVAAAGANALRKGLWHMVTNENRGLETSALGVFGLYPTAAEAARIKARLAAQSPTVVLDNVNQSAWVVDPTAESPFAFNGRGGSLSCGVGESKVVVDSVADSDHPEKNNPSLVEEVLNFVGIRGRY